MEYKQGTAIEGMGSYGKVGVKIMIALDRELTTEEKHKIDSAAEEIYRTIGTTSISLDPKHVEEVRKEREGIISLFPAPIYVKEIENEYSKAYARPWYLVTTHRGPIKIGWRKRVMEIDWSESDIKVDGVKFFSDVVSEGITVSNTFIHAWTHRKAKMYIERLLNS